ncbi:MAG: hypothetical protein Q7R70_04300 [Candidatus Diapherotrites archaeon]|nr:hypothetical protein [Candidatus Diapherotrites archaeon]
MKKAIIILIVLAAIMLAGCSQGPINGADRNDFNAIAGGGNGGLGNGSGGSGGNTGSGGSGGSGSGTGGGTGAGTKVMVDCKICDNKAANPPMCNECWRTDELKGNQCVPKACANGASNPPQCDSCSSGTWFTYSYLSKAKIPSSSSAPEVNEEGLEFERWALFPYNSVNTEVKREYYGTCISSPDNSCTNGAINPPYCSLCSKGQAIAGTGIVEKPVCSGVSECESTRTSRENCISIIEYNDQFVDGFKSVEELKSKKTTYLANLNDGKYYPASQFGKYDDYSPAEASILRVRTQTEMCFIEPAGYEQMILNAANSKGEKPLAESRTVKQVNYNDYLQGIRDRISQALGN